MEKKYEFSDLTKIKYPEFKMPTYEHIYAQASQENEKMMKAIDEAREEREKKYQDTANREKKMIELLISIDSNTAILKDMVILLQTSNENQELLIELLSTINTIATAKTKQEADSLMQQAMDLIRKKITNIETMQKLFNYSFTVFNLASKILESQI